MELDTENFMLHVSDWEDGLERETDIEAEIEKYWGKKVDRTIFYADACHFIFQISCKLFCLKCQEFISLSLSLSLSLSQYASVYTQLRPSNPPYLSYAWMQKFFVVGTMSSHRSYERDGGAETVWLVGGRGRSWGGFDGNEGDRC